MQTSFVESSVQLWILWLQSKTWQTLPSVLLGIKNEYVAYCLNYATYYFGVTVENELDKASHKPSKQEKATSAARNRKLEQILSGNKASTSNQFMDPAHFFS